MPGAVKQNGAGIYLSHRVQRLSSSCFQTDGAGQALLLLVECPEPLSTKFQGRGHVQSVESPQAQSSPVASGEAGAEREGRFGHGNLHPQPALPVLLKPLVAAIGLGSRDGFSKDVLFNGVSPLGYVERRQPDGRMGSHSALGLE